MRSIKRILVSLPPVSDSRALQRAEKLALKLDAALDLLVMDPHVDQGGFLAQQLGHLHALGIRAEGRQAGVDSAEGSNVILETADLLGSDLLVKQHIPDTWLKKHLTLPDDWHLARESRVPLLLVQGDQPWAEGNMLAAMDVEQHDPLHLALQGNVIDYASQLSELFAAQLNVVSAYMPVSHSQRIDFSEFERAVAGHVVGNPFAAVARPQADAFHALQHASEQHCLDQCRWFQEEYGLGRQQMHIGEGPARILIPAVAGELQASLVVLGTVARHGLFGALVGNTAETVLDTLHCDVLILQPHIIDTAQLGKDSHQAA